MKPITFFAQGIPKGQPRPRAFAFNGKARVYDPGTSENWKSCIAIAAKPFLPLARIAVPVFVECTFLLPRPKNHFGTGSKSAILRPDAPYFCARKPDLDNYEKAVWDTLVTIGFLVDDALIVQSRSTKLYTRWSDTGAVIRIGLADAKEPEFDVPRKAISESEPETLGMPPPDCVAQNLAVGSPN